MNNAIVIDDFTAGVDRLHAHFDNVIVAGDLNYDFKDSPEMSTIAISLRHF